MVNQIRVRYFQSNRTFYVEMRGLRSLIIFTLVTTVELLLFGLKIQITSVMWKMESVRSWKISPLVGIDWDESQKHMKTIANLNV